MCGRMGMRWDRRRRCFWRSSPRGSNHKFCCCRICRGSTRLCFWRMGFRFSTSRRGRISFRWSHSDLKVIDVLSRAKRVLITTHVRPDGDALGSTAAMFLALKSKGIESQVLLLSHLPRKYAFVFLENGISFLDVEAGSDQFSMESFRSEGN